MWRPSSICARFIVTTNPLLIHIREEKQNLFRPLADMNCFKSIAEFDQFVCESIRFSSLSELDLQKTCFNSIEFVIKFKFTEQNHPLSS